MSVDEATPLPSEAIILSPGPASDEAFQDLFRRLVPILSPVPVRICRGDGSGDPPPRAGAALIAGGQPATAALLRSMRSRHIPHPDWPDGVWSWIHLTSSGSDLFHDWLPLPGTPLLTYGRGVNARSVAEWCLAAMLWLLRDLGHYADAARERRWDRRWARELSGRSVNVIGAGSAGGELARVGSALGLQMYGASRSGAPQAGFRRVVRMDELDSVWSQGDVTVVLLPRTPHTRGTIGAAEIGRLKPGSLLIVASRGGIVDEDAVVDAVRSGHLAGAAFDVFEEEPLPAHSSLWNEPGILVTPHVAGTTDRFMERTAGIIERIWRAGFLERDSNAENALDGYRYRVEAVD